MWFGLDGNFAINDPIDTRGNTALHIASSSYRSNPIILRDLLLLGADPNKTNSVGRTSLHLAYDHSVATILLFSSVNLTAKDSYDCTAIQITGSACVFVSLLFHYLRRNIPLTEQDPFGRTLLQSFLMIGLRQYTDPVFQELVKQLYPEESEATEKDTTVPADTKAFYTVCHILLDHGCTLQGMYYFINTYLFLETPMSVFSLLMKYGVLNDITLTGETLFDFCNSSKVTSDMIDTQVLYKKIAIMLESGATL
jgi:hypothetical protein